jgi:glycosyltransferase involved in cell wall biosynthesis
MNSKLQPKISVVIPNYNRANEMRRCLDSLVAQTFNDFEVLVCDDGSTDNSAQVAAAYADRLELRFDSALNFGGPARPRNRGIALARAPFIAFLDSDDWWTPEKLAHSHAALAADADVVYHDLFIVRSSDQQSFPERVKSTRPQSPMFQSLLCTGMSIPNSSVVTKKTLLEQIGGICEAQELISVEDYDTWLGIARITERFVRLPVCDGYYWVGGGHISAASPKQQSRIRSLYARHVTYLPMVARRRAEGFLAYRVARIAQQHGDFDTALHCFREALKHPIELAYQFKAIYFAILTSWTSWRRSSRG